MSASRHELFDDQSSNDRSKNAVRIFLADDSQEFRSGLKELFSQSLRFEIVGEASSGPAAVWRALTDMPQAMIVRAGLRGADGNNVILTMKELLPACKIIALVDPGSASQIYASLASGADGCCIRDISIADLKKAVKTVVAGGIWYDAVVRHTLALSLASEEGAQEPVAESLNLEENEYGNDLSRYYAWCCRPRWHQERKWVSILHWVLVAILVTLTLLLTGPLVKGMLDNLDLGNSTSGRSVADWIGGPTAPIPGMAYTLFELQCRTWHRYRGTSSFDL